MKKIAIFLILLISITIIGFKEKEVEVEASQVRVDIAYFMNGAFISGSFSDLVQAYNDGYDLYYDDSPNADIKLTWNPTFQRFYLSSTYISVSGASFATNSSVYYYYTPQYTVTFKDWNNTTLKSEVVTEGANATPPSNPSRTGYTFTSWSGTYTNVTSNQTVTAQYSVNQYTVTFVGYDGKVYTTRNVDYGSNVDDIGRPSYFPDRYLTSTFNGWFKEQSFTTLFNFSTEVITSDITLYAKFTQNTYTVTFKDYDGTTLKTQTVDEGYDATPPSNPSRTGYTFNGWSGTYTNVTSNQTVTATYSVNTYTVTSLIPYIETTLYTDSSTRIQPQVSENYYQLIGNPFTEQTPFEYYHDLNYTEIQPLSIVANVQKILSYIADRYYISIDNKLYIYSSTTAGEVNFQDIESSNIIKFKVVSNYITVTPSMWNKTIKIYNIPPTNQNVSVSLYDESNYLITGMSYDGTNSSALQTMLEAADGDTSSHNFVGWSSSLYDGLKTTNEAVSFVYNTWLNQVDFVLDLKQNYTIKTYTVIFEDWKGATLKTQNVNHNTNATPPSNPSRVGYTFTSWSGTYTNVTSNRTITATYTINEYTITFRDYDNSVFTTDTVTHGSTYLYEIPDPSRITYDFVGWYKEEALINLFGFGSEVITSDITLYAKYSKITHTVTYLDYDGTTLDTQTIEDGADSTPPSNPSRVGYTFTSWSGTYTNVTTDRTITATYTINEYTITFINHDGSVYTTRDVEHGTFYVIDFPNPVLLAFSFQGWFKEDTYINEFDFENESIVTDITLYAKLVKLEVYVVQFLFYDDTVLKTQYVEQGLSATPPPNPLRDGYTFDGWDKDYTNVTSDLNVKAIYTLNTTPNEQEPIQFQYMYIVYGMGGLVGLSLLLSMFKRKKRGYRR